MLRKISDLNIGKFDAINYDTLDGKKFLKRVFYRDGYLERILENDRYFLVGEKGTGKTAYATFLSNEEYRQVSSRLKSVGSTDYEKFLALKDSGHLPMSSLKDCWKVILLMLLSVIVGTGPTMTDRWGLAPGGTPGTYLHETSGP